MKRFFSRHSVFVYIALGVLSVSVLVGLFFASPTLKNGVTLLQCKTYGSKTAQAECVFSLIKKKMLEEGIGPSLNMFATASVLYPKGLDINCHAGIHRVGDLAYYNLFYNNPDVVDFQFPIETSMCNRGFFHGIFEHLFQDRPDPAFIAKTCNRLKLNPSVQPKAASDTCFHAAGHGLFRAQTERVPESEWGIPSAFVEAPAELCASLPDTVPMERYYCTTGVESIYIQSSLLRNYGLSDPNPWNSLALCDALNSRLHPTCYFVRSLMVAEMDEGYNNILDDCHFASDALFESCVGGVVLGLVVNGVHESSYKKLLSLCTDPRVERRGLTKFCYEKVSWQLMREYWGNYVPACDLFPAQYRHICEAERT